MTHLKEILVCELIMDKRIVVEIIRRTGRKLDRIRTFTGLSALVARDPATLGALERQVGTPVRFLEGTDALAVIAKIHNLAV